MEPTGPQIEVGEPQFFTPKAILILNGFAMLMWVPLLAVLVAVPVLWVMADSLFIFLIVLVLLVHLAVAATLYFLPFGMGNPYVTHLVRQFAKPLPTNRRQFVVQATLQPRLRSGYRAFVEDADDIGILRFDDTHLVFEGDSVTIKLPLEYVSHVQLKNVGWRAMWLTGQRVRIGIHAFGSATALELVERSAWTIRESHHITRELHELISYYSQRPGATRF